MAVKSKTTLQTDTDTLLTNNSSQLIQADDLNDLITDIIDSYQDKIQSYTIAQRDLLSAAEKDIIYNTDNHRYEYFDGNDWVGLTPKRLWAFDASANPNYPAAQRGDTLVISVAGKIGGASGDNVNVGDIIICNTTTAGGTKASVGEYFYISHSGAATTDTILGTPVTITTVASQQDYTVPEISGNTVSAVFRGGSKLTSDLWSQDDDTFTIIPTDVLDDEEITIFYNKEVSGIVVNGLRLIPQTTALKDAYPFKSYATAGTVLATEVIDLTATGTYNYNFPSGMKFFVNRIRPVIVDIDYSSTGTDAEFDIGISADPILFVENHNASLGTTEGDALTLNIDDKKGVTDFQIDVTNASTMPTLKVRFVIEGFGLQNEGLE